MIKYWVSELFKSGSGNLHEVFSSDTSEQGLGFLARDVADQFLVQSGAWLCPWVKENFYFPFFPLIDIYASDIQVLILREALSWPFSGYSEAGECLRFQLWTWLHGGARTWLREQRKAATACMEEGRDSAGFLLSNFSVEFSAQKSQEQGAEMDPYWKLSTAQDS